MRKNLGLGILLCVLSLTGYAQQNVENDNKKEVEQLKEIIVSDSKFNLNPKTSGKVIAKIPQEVLSKSKGLSVSEVLMKVGGIQINGSTSNAGSTQGVFIRGGRNRQVIVRIDGVTVSDPSAGSGEFDFKLLNLEQIESIEILKGGSSALFGSGAATAVINIKLKKAVAKPISANFNITTGTNNNAEDKALNNISDTNLSASINGTSGKFSYLFSSNYQFTNGLSAAESLSEDIEFNSDSYKKQGLYAKLGYVISDKINYSLYANYDQINTSFDGGSFIDADNNIFSKQRRFGNLLKYSFGKDFKFEYTDGFAWSDRTVTSDFPAIFKSKSYTFDAFVSKKFNLGLDIAAGANGTYSSLNVFRIPFGEEKLSEQVNDRDANFDIIDPYANVVYVSDFGLNINLGGRLNIHSDYGTHFVYSANPSFNIDLNEASFFQLLASYSTAYITPSLSQLFDNSFGSANPELEPEENETFEGGFKYDRSSKHKFSAVYFHRNHENVIGFDNTTFQNINVDEAFETQGVEVAASAKFFNNDALTIYANYTYTDVKDIPNNVRIAKDVANISVGYDITKKTNVLASYQYRGKRSDSDFSTFPSTTVNLKEYNLLDFQVNQKITENFDVFARASNILNEDYQEVLGFETKGRNIKVGLNFNF